MHILIVNFNLHEMSHAEYTALCDEMAPTFAAVPGLVSKVWLSRPETNTYGGVYTWSDAAAFQAFRQSELFGAVAANPHFANVSANDFEILEAPSAVTRARTAVAAA
jgi:quinol monooxygenase YgiN